MHSPLLYQLGDRVLQQPHRFTLCPGLASFTAVPLHYRLVLTGLLETFGYPLCPWRPGNTTTLGKGQLVLVTEPDPMQWHAFVAAIAPQLQGEGIIALTDIHRTAAHTAAWRQLVHLPHIPLTVDLLELGLLWYPNGWQVKQHFVMR